MSGLLISLLLFLSAAGAELIKKSVSCPLTLSRLTQSGVKVGALWHIYEPRDASKIRDFLNKVRSNASVYNVCLILIGGARQFHKLNL